MVNAVTEHVTICTHNGSAVPWTDTKDQKVKPDFAQYGFAYQENLIMACIGGSQAHGAKLGATDDTDWYGLYISCSRRLSSQPTRGTTFLLALSFSSRKGM